MFDEGYYDEEEDYYYDDGAGKHYRYWSNDEWDSFYEELTELTRIEDEWLDYEAGLKSPETV